MKKIIVFLCLILLYIAGSSNADMITVEFGFTITKNNGYSLLEVGDKGEGWFSYDNEIAGTILDNPEPLHDTGYYQGILNMSTSSFEIWAGEVEILMLNNYSNTDEFELRYQKTVGDNKTCIDLSFAGPTDLWNSLPTTLPILDFDLFTNLHGYMWNYHLGSQDKSVYWSYDYINNVSEPVPEPATCLLLLFGLAGLVAIKKKS